jgi:7-carboxy-7-deazaguanine synthase
MTDLYRLAEPVFFSIQGEGKYAGTPSLWVRTFGCNLKCPGFPCDTEYAWNKEMRQDSLMFSAEEIVLQLEQLLVTPSNPEGIIKHPVTRNSCHIVFTGGEPLLPKYQRMVMAMVDIMASSGHAHIWFPLNEYNETECINITFESNGTQKLSPEFRDFCNQFDHINPFFSLSPKLKTASGEVGAVDVDNIMEIIQTSNTQIKFVCDESDECAEELDGYVKQIVTRSIEEECWWVDCSDNIFWVMPKGTTREDQLNVAGIVEKYQAKGYNIATRNHTYIWSDAQGR